MKNIIFLILIIFKFNSIQAQTYYRGLERMCSKDSEGKGIVMMSQEYGTTKIQF